MGLPTAGTSWLGVMPDASLLKQIHKIGLEDQQEDVRQESLCEHVPCLTYSEDKVLCEMFSGNHSFWNGRFD